MGQGLIRQHSSVRQALLFSAVVAVSLHGVACSHLQDYLKENAGRFRENQVEALEALQNPESQGGGVDTVLRDGLFTAGDGTETAAENGSMAATGKPPVHESWADGKHHAEGADRSLASVEPREGALRGRIRGLSSPGLVLIDALGNILRPPSGATEYQFDVGTSPAPTLDRNTVTVVRHPRGQECFVRSVAAGMDRPGTASYDIDCLGRSERPPRLSMQDCFRLSTRGSSFSLGYLDEKRRVVRYADVSLEPIGAERQHHRTFVGGRLLLEAIIRYPLTEPVAEVEWLRFYGQVAPSDSWVRHGKSGGMPLDLVVGEERTYSVLSTQQGVNQPHGKLSSTNRVVKLVEVAPLTTHGFHFPVACRMEDGPADLPARNEVWYAPGYGPVKIGGDREKGRPVMEVVEVQQQAE